MPAIFSPSEPIRSLAEGLTSYYGVGSATLFIDIIINLLLKELRNEPPLNEWAAVDVENLFHSYGYTGQLTTSDGFTTEFSNILDPILQFVNSYSEAWYSNVSNPMNNIVTYHFTFNNLIIEVCSNVKEVDTRELRMEMKRFIDSYRNRYLNPMLREELQELKVVRNKITEELYLLESLHGEDYIAEEVKDRTADLHSLWLREKGARKLTW